ncbi:hypothetical protein [Hymenobacter norwichensis]|uniref:hypothetical protein n=1 Tax=Hymenobacter norwichensis TaxID=223903 RepID=UPI0003B6565E|nr:hypothetical protein [Hymenobacter norwichensis]
MKTQLLGAAFGLLLCTRPAVAQDLSPALDPVMLGQGLVLSSTMYAQAERDAARKGIKLKDTASPTKSPAARLTYTPTPALRQQTVRNLAQRLQQSKPAQAQYLQAAYGPGKANYAQLYSAGLKGSGFQDNDAASALAAYMEIAYAVVNNVQNEALITPAMDRGLRNQVAGILGRNPAARNPATLAQVGEELKLQTVILATGWQQSRQTGQTATFRANIARQFSNQFGFDLTKVRLTERGFAAK